MIASIIDIGIMSGVIALIIVLLIKLIPRVFRFLGRLVGEFKRGQMEAKMEQTKKKQKQ